MVLPVCSIGDPDARDRRQPRVGLNGWRQPFARAPFGVDYRNGFRLDCRTFLGPRIAARRGVPDDPGLWRLRSGCDWVLQQFAVDVCRRPRDRHRWGVHGQVCRVIFLDEWAPTKPPIHRLVRGLDRHPSGSPGQSSNRPSATGACHLPRARPDPSRGWGHRHRAPGPHTDPAVTLFGAVVERPDQHHLVLVPGFVGSQLRPDFVVPSRVRGGWCGGFWSLRDELWSAVVTLLCPCRPRCRSGGSDRCHTRSSGVGCLSCSGDPRLRAPHSGRLLQHKLHVRAELRRSCRTTTERLARWLAPLD